MGIVGSSQLHHFQPVFHLDDFFCDLVGRNGGRDKDDLLELECLPNFFCAPEMTEMDGIEGPSEQPDPSPYCSRLFFYLCLPLIAECVASRSWNDGIME